MKSGQIVAMVVAGLVVGFGCGWVVAQAQNVNKLTPDQVWTDQWISDVMLLTGGGHRTTLMSPDKTQSIIKVGLNSDSLVLGRVYDHLPESMKQQLMFYIPAARAIAKAQERSVSDNGKKNLSVLIDCMQKMKLKGGSVKGCIENEHK